MRYAIAMLAMILGGFVTLEIASHVYWVLETFAVIGLLVVFGGGTWLVARRWDVQNENKRRRDLERLREGELPSKPGFFD